MAAARACVRGRAAERVRERVRVRSARARAHAIVPGPLKPLSRIKPSDQALAPRYQGIHQSKHGSLRTICEPWSV
eukprot:5550433-Pleurochrysis_carterae.AAC.1